MSFTVRDIFYAGSIGYEWCCFFVLVQDFPTMCAYWIRHDRFSHSSWPNQLPSHKTQLWGLKCGTSADGISTLKGTLVAYISNVYIIYTWLYINILNRNPMFTDFLYSYYRICFRHSNFLPCEEWFHAETSGKTPRSWCLFALIGTFLDACVLTGSSVECYIWVEQEPWIWEKSVRMS